MEVRWARVTLSGSTRASVKEKVIVTTSMGGNDWEAEVKAEGESDRDR